MVDGEDTRTQTRPLDPREDFDWIASQSGSIPHRSSPFTASTRLRSQSQHFLVPKVSGVPLESKAHARFILFLVATILAVAGTDRNVHIWTRSDNNVRPNFLLSIRFFIFS